VPVGNAKLDAYAETLFYTHTHTHTHPQVDNSPLDGVHE